MPEARIAKEHKLLAGREDRLRIMTQEIAKKLKARAR